jgi:hypothetical protein
MTGHREPRGEQAYETNDHAFMGETLDSLFSGEFGGAITGTETVLLALLIAFVIGHIVAWVYMITHEGLSYSRMFTGSLLAMPVLVAVVMILMSGSIVVAFGLIAIFTVVRFRNVLKDTRDTTFVLWSIIEGMACGTLRFGIALLACLVLTAVFLYLRVTMFGGRHHYDVIVNLHWTGNGDSREVLRPILRRHSLKAQLAGHRPMDDENHDLSYRLKLRDPTRSHDLLSDLEAARGVGRVTLYRREEESEV